MRLGDGILTGIADRAGGQFVVAKFQYLYKKVDGTAPTKRRLSVVAGVPCMYSITRLVGTMVLGSSIDLSQLKQRFNSHNVFALLVRYEL